MTLFTENPLEKMMVQMIRNTMVASRTLTSNLTNKLLDMMTSDWFLKALEDSKF